jgi:hypothetical protein
MMDLWKEELEHSIIRGLEDSDDEFEVQLMEDIFFALEEPRKHVHRDWEACHKHLVKDYFDENSSLMR